MCSKKLIYLFLMIIIIITIKYNMNSPFLIACKEGNLKEVINIYNKDKPNIHAKDDQAFRNACYYGNIKIAQLIYGL